MGYFPALKPQTNNKKRNYQRVCHQCLILCRSLLSFFLQFSFTYQVDPVLSLFLSRSLSNCLSFFPSFYLSISLYPLSRSSLYTAASCNELDNISRWLRFGVFSLTLSFSFFNCIIGIALTCR